MILINFLEIFKLKNIELARYEYFNCYNEYTYFPIHMQSYNKSEMNEPFKMNILGDSLYSLQSSDSTTNGLTIPMYDFSPVL